MNRLGIIGAAGLLGSTIAFCIALQELVDEIVLIDINENLLKSHIMDMEQSMSELSRTKISAGTWESLGDCNLIIMTASRPHIKVRSRNEFLKANLDIVANVAQKIKTYAKDAVIINATAPVDVYNYIFFKMIGGDRRKLIGLNRNDSLRLKWAIGRVLGVDARGVDAMVIGEHGETQVPLYSSIKVQGETIKLLQQDIQKIDDMIKNWFIEYNALDAGRTTGWTSGTSTGQLIKHIVGGSEAPVCCSAVLENEYGLSGLSIGVPLKVGVEGWQEIVDLDLTREEKEAFQLSADFIKDLITQCGY